MLENNGEAIVIDASLDASFVGVTFAYFPNTTRLLKALKILLMNMVLMGLI